MAKKPSTVKAVDKKAILITGASSGMGFEAAKELALQGHSVYGAARRVERTPSGGSSPNADASTCW